MGSFTLPRKPQEREKKGGLAFVAAGKGRKKLGEKKGVSWSPILRTGIGKKEGAALLVKEKKGKDVRWKPAIHWGGKKRVNWRWRKKRGSE